MHIWPSVRPSQLSSYVIPIGTVFTQMTGWHCGNDPVNVNSSPTNEHVNIADGEAKPISQPTVHMLPYVVPRQSWVTVVIAGSVSEVGRSATYAATSHGMGMHVGGVPDNAPSALHVNVWGFG